MIMSNLDMFFSGDEYPPNVRETKATVALSPSRLPGLDFALNPYQGCSHRCTYCYAPYITRQPVDEWGCIISAKMNLPVLLDRELPRNRGMIGLGTVTDPYQPAERVVNLTRRCLEILVKHRAKVSILTKSPLVTRDIDLISKLNDSEVGITITAMDSNRATIFEPYSTPPSERLDAMKILSNEGVSVYALIGPIIPTITDFRLDEFLDSIRDTGASIVMVDRLNLRPGMDIRLLKRMKEMDPSSLSILEKYIKDREFYDDIINRIRNLCENRDLEYRDAF